jgi:hypothetical protein
MKWTDKHRDAHVVGAVSGDPENRGGDFLYILYISVYIVVRSLY